MRRSSITAVPPIVLDRNENQYGPSPECYETLRRADLEQLSLYSRIYTQGKKSPLSDRLSREIGIPEERILLSYGSEDLLKQAVHCYLKRGEIMLLPRQSWWYYKAVAGEVSGKQVEYDLKERDDRFVYDAREIIALAESHNPRIILIASPGNPTGNSIASADLGAILEHCQETVILLDEAYSGFADEADDHLRVLLNSHPRLVILRTFSKYYALAGLRIGYACVGEGVDLLVRFSARYLGYNRLSEQIALAALDSKEYYRRIAQQMRSDNEAYFAFFRSLPGFTPFRTEANFMLVRFPRNRKTELQSALTQRGVFVKFLEDLPDCFRVSTGTREQNARVIEVFREVAGGL